MARNKIVTREQKPLGIAQKLYAAGYTDLVSVIPPDGPLSPNSRIAEDQRGKVPGLHGMRGWYGYRWDEPVAPDLPDRIDRSGANIGIRGQRFPGLDLDTEEPDLSIVVTKIAHEILGPAPVRLSREPRRLLMYRTDRPFKKRAAVITYKGRSHTVEMLADGQQYLVHGTHPSGAQYRWEGFLSDPAKLTAVTEEKVDAFFAVLASRLGEKGISVEVLTPGRKAGATAEPVPDKITAGARNATLASLAGTLRHRNMSREAAEAALREENAARCEPPLPDEEVERIVDSIYSNYAAGPDEVVIPADEEFKADPNAKPPGVPFTFRKAGELAQEPDEEVEWVVDGLLPARGSSIFTAKPKVGKSTLARALAVAVAAGRPWLDRDVTQGPVIYMRFPGEGRTQEARQEWRRLGVTADLPLWDLEVENAIEMRKQLGSIVAKVDPVLVVVDTLQHLIQAKDLNDYAKVHAALAPVHTLARGAHVLCLHHSPKHATGDVTDAALGSIVLFGAVDVGLHLRRDQRDQEVRYLEALGRGVEVEPHIVKIDPETHEPYLTMTSREGRLASLEESILANVADATVLQRDLIGAAGREDPRRIALERLLDRGMLMKLGTGRRGDPFLIRAVEAADEFVALDETQGADLEATAIPTARQGPYFEESGSSPPKDDGNGRLEPQAGKSDA